MRIDLLLWLQGEVRGLGFAAPLLQGGVVSPNVCVRGPCMGEKGGGVGFRLWDLGLSSVRVIGYCVRGPCMGEEGGGLGLRVYGHSHSLYLQG